MGGGARRGSLVVLVVNLSLTRVFSAGALCQLVFRDSPATSTVLVSYPTTLRCSARDPAPPSNILWLRNGTAVSPDTRVTTTYDSTAGDSELRIASVSYIDAGGYQCVATGSSNEILAVSSVGNLIVHGVKIFRKQHCTKPQGHNIKLCSRSRPWVKDKIALQCVCVWGGGVGGCKIPPMDQCVLQSCLASPSSYYPAFHCEMMIT